jgi:hypothetical protein
MNARNIATLVAAALLVAATAGAQSGADLLQKGIYTQETLGDLDGAVGIYRQITASTAAPKQLAAQAQYQLVLCMLQKGDRTAASREFDLLTRNFPDQQDLIAKARKLIPGASTLLAAPWAEGEASQLNIKRNGVFTGEYLYYSATPWRDTVYEAQRTSSDPRVVAHANDTYLTAKLLTSTSTRTIHVLVDCNTLQRKEPDNFSTNDVLGDASAAPFAGPAIDVEPLVFRMRLLPLAVGYRTTLTTLPFLIGFGIAKPVELAVAAVEPVQTIAGKFNCYKMSIAPLGQTFWIGVDGARPLVKFQSGNVQAELVKVWGPSVIGDSLAFLAKSGWAVTNILTSPTFGNGEPEAASAQAASPKEGPYGSASASVFIKRIYTPPADLEATVQKFCADAKAIPAQTRTVAGHPSIGCQRDSGNSYSIWVGSDSLILQFSGAGVDTAIFRWMFEPILDTIQLPKD